MLSVLERYQKNISGEYYIFWSRIDDTKKWWDIDILVVNKSQESDLRLSLDIERELFSISEEKIDVVVFPENMNPEQKTFFESIPKKQLWTI